MFDGIFRYRGYLCACGRIDDYIQILAISLDLLIERVFAQIVRLSFHLHYFRLTIQTLQLQSFRCGDHDIHGLTFLYGTSVPDPFVVIVG